eukprot:TRINITY_DN23348_c0_g1_i2.p1 TRINITY_DN23348_c0_g1~~TRINITY_DN23348_c0_g1_i2.p1  ORF type:complete len:659 (+),score=29.10 TRINITY_DN23348_c0_g1_i2:172-2148(+)
MMRGAPLPHAGLPLLQGPPLSMPLFQRQSANLPLFQRPSNVPLFGAAGDAMFQPSAATVTQLDRYRQLAQQRASRSESSQSASLWRVTGGRRSGLIVREGFELTSRQYDGIDQLDDESESEENYDYEPWLLQRGAIVEELELVGNRLHYVLISGDGPPGGWVSLSITSAAGGVKRLLEQVTQTRNQSASASSSSGVRLRSRSRSRSRHCTAAVAGPHQEDRAGAPSPQSARGPQNTTQETSQALVSTSSTTEDQPSSTQFQGACIGEALSSPAMVFVRGRIGFVDATQTMQEDRARMSRKWRVKFGHTVEEVPVEDVQVHGMDEVDKARSGVCVPRPASDDDGNVSCDGVSVEECVHLPGQLGVFANKEFRLAQAILHEEPVLKSRDSGSMSRAVKKMELQRAFALLPPPKQAAVSKLHTLSRGSAALINMFETNAFLTGDEGSELFLLLSRVNHSCDPNCVKSCNVDGSSTLIALRDIKQGEEITVSYESDCYLLLRDEERRAHPRLARVRPCKCQRCRNQECAGQDLSVQHPEFEHVPAGLVYGSFSQSRLEDYVAFLDRRFRRPSLHRAYCREELGDRCMRRGLYIGAYEWFYRAMREITYIQTAGGKDLQCIGGKLQECLEYAQRGERCRDETIDLQQLHRDASQVLPASCPLQ